MAWILQCKRGEQSEFDCCSGGSGQELFSGLLITDDDGNETRIYTPFEVHYSVLQAFVYLSDYKGNRKRIDLANTSFSTLDELLQFISNCQSCECGINAPPLIQQCYQQDWIGHSGAYVEVTDFQLPQNLEDYPYLVEVFRDGGKGILGVDYTPDPASNRIYPTRIYEGEDIEVIRCSRKDWLYENFIGVSGASIQVSVARIPVSTSDWIHEEFLNVSGDGVVLTKGGLPSLAHDLNMYVYRDGGKGIYGQHFTIDNGLNKVLFPRDLEGEDVQVYWKETDVDSVLRVYRDGGKGIFGEHFTIDTVNNNIVPTRSYENENIQVYIKAR